MDWVINSKGTSPPKKEERPLSSLYIPYVKGVSKKFKVVVNRYHIRRIFKTKLTLRIDLKGF
jgi:hypothetical protein